MVQATSKPRRTATRAKKKSRENVSYTNVQTNNMLNGIFDSAGMGTLSGMSHPFQLGASSMYNPLTLNRVLISYAYMTFGIIQTFIDQPIEDAFRGGVEIESDELNEEDLDQLQDVLVECGDYAEVKDVMRWARLYGGAGLIINTEQDPLKELDMEAVNDRSPLTFISADRWELCLQFPSRAKEPCPYNYYGQSIHKTRVLKVNGKTAPSFIRQRLQGWGMSEIERVIRDMNSYVKNQEVIYELLDEAKIDVWHLEGLNQMLLSTNGQSQITKRIEMATQMKNFLDSLVMDKEDTYDQKQLSFGGLAEIQQQNRMGIASAVRMPMTKLFGISAAGFNSGEDDLENYNSMIESEIRGRAHEIMMTVIKLRCQQVFGFIPEHLNVTFKPLRILTSEQEETVKDQKFQRGSTLYSQGILDDEEYVEYLKKNEILMMKTKIGDGTREAEPPTPATDVDLPQKVITK